jgi:high affinity Mn2+ porin
MSQAPIKPHVRDFGMTVAARPARAPAIALLLIVAAAGAAASPGATARAESLASADTPAAADAATPADTPAAVAATPADAPAPARGQLFAVHGQLTYVEQDTSNFNAPYRGRNSLSPGRGAETTDATLYVGARLWSGAEAWIDEEIDEGHGLDDTLGVAGFPSGEAYKVGRNAPYFRTPRAFIRQTLDLGGDPQAVDAAANQLSGERAANRVVITLGKLSVVDLFDTNQYAHDPRGDFLNWAAIDAGTFDYAADAWGYSVGAAVEWYQGPWTTRLGVFDLSDVPNSPHLDPGFHEFQALVEGERRLAIHGHAGRVVLTAYESRGRMGLLDSADPPDIAAVRQYRGRGGASLDLEQELSPDLGAFLRIGKAAGNVETYEFTDIDRSQAAGLSLRGTRWQRPSDTVGLAVIDDEISAARERFLDAGGLGILVGDGRLPHPGPEHILETYYSLGVLGCAHLTLDYQWIAHPAYNRDRGPVSVLAVRAHAEF